MTDTSKRKCKVCRCTDRRACEGGCSWVRSDLCSACDRGPGEVSRYLDMVGQPYDFKKVERLGMVARAQLFHWARALYVHATDSVFRVPAKPRLIIARILPAAARKAVRRGK